MGEEVGVCTCGGGGVGCVDWSIGGCCLGLGWGWVVGCGCDWGSCRAGLRIAHGDFAEEVEGGLALGLTLALTLVLFVLWGWLLGMG